jgi:hypothetical protein
MHSFHKLGKKLRLCSCGDITWGLSGKESTARYVRLGREPCEAGVFINFVQAFQEGTK